ncbi:MAG: SUF system NifU family Fe-S cluster assembly protein [Acholeplasmatales bacterium]|jgi:nitrogen fixation NifU-like protein|nr:SUF system NifU family Fe-S cluster assembly protein [Acholeplasmatales bacterium]
MNITDMYKQVIMDHYKNPRNKGVLNDSSYLTINLNNPSCGDEVIIQIKVIDGVIKDVRQGGHGCSICCSSASVASETLVNKTLNEALEIITQFYELVKGLKYNEELLEGDAIAFSGVANFPARIKCATLSWKAVEKGIGELQK